MNVLEILQRTAKAVGITAPPTGVVASTDPQALQLVELLNQEGRALSSRHSWQVLTYEATFTTVATEVQGSLSTIIGAGQSLRHVVNETMWNRTTKEPVYGPRRAPTWQGYKALSFAGPYAEYRIRGDQILFQPVPAAGETIYFEYVSRSWAVNQAGTTYTASVTADTDEVLLPEEIVLLGLEWRWKRAKGLDHGSVFQDYEFMVADAIARDGSKPVLNLSMGSVEDVPVAIPRLIGS